MWVQLPSDNSKSSSASFSRISSGSVPKSTAKSVIIMMSDACVYDDFFGVWMPCSECCVCFLFEVYVFAVGFVGAPLYRTTHSRLAVGVSGFFLVCDVSNAGSKCGVSFLYFCRFVSEMDNVVGFCCCHCYCGWWWCCRFLVFSSIQQLHSHYSLVFRLQYSILHRHIDTQISVALSLALAHSFARSRS